MTTLAELEALIDKMEKTIIRDEKSLNMKKKGLENAKRTHKEALEISKRLSNAIHNQVTSERIING
jgi:exonuclease VII small subunit